MNAIVPLTTRLTVLAQRLDALSLRERGLVFAAGMTLVYIAWQTLLMTPLNIREHVAEQRLEEARRHLTALEQGMEAGADPVVAAATRNRALQQQLAKLDAELDTAASSYVTPQRMIEMLREILTRQEGLTLVSLANLPVQSLSQTSTTQGAADPAATLPKRSTSDRGPFLHPVEIVVDGDFMSVVAYLRAIEALPWRIQWQRLELTAGDYPNNRVRIVIGALSLSPDWISV